MLQKQWPVSRKRIMQHASTNLEILYCEHSFHIVVNVTFTILPFNLNPHSSNGQLKIQTKLSEILSILV